MNREFDKKDALNLSQALPARKQPDLNKLGDGRRLKVGGCPTRSKTDSSGCLCLYLFPNLLADLESHTAFLPSSVDATVRQIRCLIAESEKAGRRFLRRFDEDGNVFRETPIRLLNEHSSEAYKKELLQEMMQKKELWGLVSDCGMPCLADPGADFVLMARRKGIHVETFVGPSSILFALVLSGLGGQRFTFHGYLPKEESILSRELKRMEQISLQEKSTHLFIEAPYRNNRLLEMMVKWLNGQTWICVACDLTLPSQFIQTKMLKEWKQHPLPDLNKRPTVFVLRVCR